ncbi:MAG TPA: hypothetical protein VNV66_12050, partial [Pilimelia sp.]|nr:hypothetical protein [Pilimelia sp.]
PEVVPTRQTGRRPPPRPSARVELQVYGPLRCTASYSWDPGHPALAQPCHATGPKIRLLGRMQALPGVQADISLWLADDATGTRVAGPFTCVAVMFTDAAPARDCGPFDTPAEHGRRYVVVQEWGYTNQRMLPGGSARSDPFTW